MTGWTTIKEYGWFGFGRTKDSLFPSVSLGVVRYSWCWGTLAQGIKRALPGKPSATACIPNARSIAARGQRA